MSREIKFRGMTFEGEWIFGYYIQIESEGKSYGWIFKQGFQIAVKMETVGQYIGLKDKNGKEIYEGDILEADDKSGTIVIEYGGGCFYGKNTDPDSPFQETLNRNWLSWYVIGDIHQNPELLNPSPSN